MKQDLNEVRRELDWTRQQLDDRLHRLRDDGWHRLRPLAADAADRAQETQNDEVLERLETSTQRLVNQYRHAIARLDAGLYGVCEECDYPIEPERLAAVPQATLCSVCANDEKAQAA